MLASRTGRREVFDDVETLVAALVARGLVDDRAGPAGAPLEQLLGAPGDPGAPRPGAEELVAALIAHAGSSGGRSTGAGAVTRARAASPAGRGGGPGRGTGGWS
ncbi:hypothetical protein [Geodermatophilus sp. URMC 62]|uniref:hypothetical protein n=1 Tax=Geodermatophilus sp. URMC 62 TaxID=3423414 RepID=UPI00406CA967